MINRHQDSQAKREEEFQVQVQQARQPGGMDNATPEVKEAATRQANFAEQRKKYLGDM
jgi:hypothetical protein